MGALLNCGRARERLAGEAGWPAGHGQAVGQQAVHQAWRWAIDPAAVQSLAHREGPQRLLQVCQDALGVGQKLVDLLRGSTGRRLPHWCALVCSAGLGLLAKPSPARLARGAGAAPGQRQARTCRTSSVGRSSSMTASASM
jgi:hypothetical protein